MNDFPRPTMPRLLCWLCLLGSGAAVGVVGKAWAWLAYLSTAALIFALFEIARAIENKR